MIHTAKEISTWVNFGHFPKEEKLPNYMTEDCKSIDVYDVIKDTLDKAENKKIIVEKIRMLIDGVE